MELELELELERRENAQASRQLAGARQLQSGASEAAVKGCPLTRHSRQMPDEWSTREMEMGRTRWTKST